MKSKPLTLAEARAKAQTAATLPKKQAIVNVVSEELPKKEAVTEPQQLAQSAQNNVEATTPSETPEKPAKTRKHPAARLRPSRKTPREALQDLSQAPQHSVERTPEVQREADAAFAIPYEAPFFDFDHAIHDPEAELASRELCRRHLLPFIQRFRPKYKAGWVHADVCRRLERFVRDVENGKEPRLLLLMPPRSGKSEIGSRHLSPWILGQHPDWEIIAASHTASLTMSFSRYLRDLMMSEAYNAVFPDAVLDPSSRAVENWNLTKGGGYLAAGVGTGITGRGCLAPYTLVDTNRGKIRIIDLKVGDSVYGYDHEQQKVVETRVQALQITERSKPLLDCGAVRLTTDHRIYNAARGFYTRAGESPSLLGLRRQEGAARCHVQSMLFKGADRGDHNAQMRLLWEELQAQRCGAPEVEGQAWREGASVLRQDVLRAVQGGSSSKLQQGEGRMPSVREASDGHGSLEVLQQGVLQRVQGFETDDGCIQWCILDTEKTSSPAGQEMLVVWINPRTFRSSSSGRERGESVDYESGSAMHGVPPQISSVHGTCAADVAELFSPFDFVVDIQTGTGNFFTEGLLVHNCHVLVIDDVVKDIEAADSVTIRDNTWEWYISTAYTRLAPGGGVLGILTWWHDDDWAGRIQQAMEAGDGDKFEIVKYPAINEVGDEYILEDDSIIEIAQGTPVPHGARMTRPHNTAIHPERYTTEAMLRIKRNAIAAGMKRTWDALYQQNPIPDEGNYFSKEYFRHYSTAPTRRDIYVYQAWDFAISEGKESDFNVGVTIGVDHRDSIYVLDMTRFKTSDGNMLIETVVDYARQWMPDTLGVEDGQIWKALESQFSKVCDEKKYWPSFEVLKPLTDKMVRASPLRGRMQAGKVYFDKEATYWRDLQKEMLHFPAGKHDDVIDSLAWAVRLTLTRSAPQRKDLPPTPKSWKDDLDQFIDGSLAGASHMAA